jgi:hypothetical protein
MPVKPWGSQASARRRRHCPCGNGCRAERLREQPLPGPLSLAAVVYGWTCTAQAIDQTTNQQFERAS